MTILEILSKNRDLQTQVEEAEHLLTEIDIESLPSFNIGFRRGKAEGKAEGSEEGKAGIVHSLLSRVGVAEVSELLGLAPEAVKRIEAKGSDDDLPRDRR